MAWVRFPSGTPNFFLWPTLVSCRLSHLSHILISELKIRHLSLFIITKEISSTLLFQNNVFSVGISQQSNGSKPVKLFKYSRVSFINHTQQAFALFVKGPPTSYLYRTTKGFPSLFWLFPQSRTWIDNYMPWANVSCMKNSLSLI